MDACGTSSIGRVSLQFHQDALRSLLLPLMAAAM